MKIKSQLLLFTLAHIVIFLTIFKSGLYDQRFTAAGLYLDYASRTFAGQIPYQGFSLEYPPMALLFFLLPRMVSSNLEIYSFAFTTEMLVFDLIGLFVLEAMSRYLGIAVWKTLAIYTTSLLAVGSIIDLRYDLVPAIMVLVALYTFCLRKHTLSWGLLAVGTMTKIYPAVIAPIFLIYHLKRRQYRQIITGIAAFALVCLAIALPFLYLAPGGLLASFAYHAKRGLQLESTYSSILLLIYSLRTIPIWLEFNYGSWNLVGPIADNIAKYSTVLVLIALFAIYWFYLKKSATRDSSRETNVDMAYLLNFSTLSILAFMLSEKVLSPQFIVWLYPLVPLIIGPWRNGAWLSFIILSIMTYYVFPLHYIELLGFDRLTIDILLWRNFLLAVFMFALLFKTTGGEFRLPLNEIVSKEVKGGVNAQSSAFRDQC